MAVIPLHARLYIRWRTEKEPLESPWFYILRAQLAVAKNGMLYPEELLLLCTIDGVNQRHSYLSERALSSRVSQEIEHYTKKTMIRLIWRPCTSCSPFSRKNQADSKQGHGHHSTIYMCLVIRRSLASLYFSPSLKNQRL